MPSTRKFSSSEGCCICGSNSSKEPFVKAEKISQSKKCMGDVFQNCFKLNEERKGEWCVSCKDVAKKWLKTSKARRNSTNFRKLVDSRRRSSQRTTRRSIEARDDEETEADNDEKDNVSLKTKFAVKENQEAEEKANEGGEIPLIEDALSDDENDDEMDGTAKLIESPPVAFDSPFDNAFLPGDDSQSSVKRDTKTIATQTAFLYPALTSPQANANKLPFIDLSKWRQEEICCGTIFRGPNGEVLVDPKWLRPLCTMCNRSTQPPTPMETCKSEEISVFDDKLVSLCS